MPRRLVSCTVSTLATLAALGGARRYDEDDPDARIHRRDGRWTADPGFEYRVQDLLGNLREWTSTVFRPYPYKQHDGREGWSGVGAVVVRPLRGIPLRDVRGSRRLLGWPRRSTT